MTKPGDDHEHRITSAEAKVRELRQEVAHAVAESGAARVLAAGADKEVADVREVLRVQVGLLNALHETQQEHTRRFDAMDGRFDAMDGRFDAMDGRFDAMDGRFDAMDGRLGRIDERFGQVDGRFDAMDVRFGRIDERFGQVDAQFVQIDENFASVQQQFATVHAGIAQIVRLLTPGDTTA